LKQTSINTGSGKRRVENLLPSHVGVWLQIFEDTKDVIQTFFPDYRNVTLLITDIL
jgi:hypothetical protein